MENRNDLNGLNLKGFEDDFTKFDISIFSNNTTIELIRPEIKKFLKKTKTINRENYSYNLKNILENHIGRYVSNGELIYAMHLEGYIIKRDGINCYFNVSKAGTRLLNNYKTINTTLHAPLNFQIESVLVYKKFKYNFNFIIERKFSNVEGISKRDVVEIMAFLINESYNKIKYWINIRANDKTTIPQGSLEILSKIFNIKTEELINNPNV